MSDPRIVSKAEKVTFFEDRAAVERSAIVRPGRSVWVGVSALIDDDSIEARTTTAGARVLSAKVHREMITEHADGQGALDARLRAERDAEDEVYAIGAKLDEAEHARHRAEWLLHAWATAVAEAPTKLAEADARRAIEVGLSEIDARIAAAIADADVQRRALVEAKLAWNRASTLRAQAQRTTPRLVAEVRLEVEAEGDADVAITLAYRVPSALFRPEHLARLEGDAVTIETYATAWQRTGEEWTGARLAFSTARPGRAPAPPLLEEDVLETKRRESSSVVVEARDETVQIASASVSTARITDEMPGVDDGGEPLVFEASEIIDVPSTGRPVRVPIARVTLAAKVTRVATPELAAAPHVRATMTLAGARPLLAGPLRVARGASLVGRARLPFVGVGEPFDIGFGADEAVRVRRETKDDRETSMLGAQRLARTVTIFVANVSNDPKRFVIEERVPVSGIDGVEVTVAAKGFTIDERDGFLRRDVELGPRSREKLTYTWELKASSKIVLPAL